MYVNKILELSLTRASELGYQFMLIVYLYVLLVNPTDEPDNVIRLLKTDLNSLICLLKIDQAPHFKIPNLIIFK